MGKLFSGVDDYILSKNVTFDYAALDVKFGIFYLKGAVYSFSGKSPGRQALVCKTPSKQGLQSQPENIFRPNSLRPINSLKIKHKTMQKMLFKFISGVK